MILKLIILSIFNAYVLAQSESKNVYFTGICDINSCRYGDCEIYNATTFRCHCFKGVTGVRCDQLAPANTPCASNPCFGDSTCFPLAGDSFICNCPTGRVGTLCESHTGPCKCQNGGTCITTGTNSYVCTCSANFGGNLCEVNLLDCKIRLCQNQGYCASNGICICSSGFSGKYCEIVGAITTTATTTIVPASFCRSTICRNGGTCREVSPTVGYCECLKDFYGLTCDIYAPPTTTTTTTTSTTTLVASFCRMTVCRNGGTCREVSATVGYCECLKDFYGQLCEIYSPVTTTTTKPGTQICPLDIAPICKNGAQCLISATAISCICTANFVGQFCETSTISTTTTTAATTTKAGTQICPIDIAFICKNGAQCLISGTDISCICAPNFIGTFCETSTGTTITTTTTASTTTTALETLCPTAAAGICKNDATCVLVNGGSFKCVCKIGFTGIFCETQVPFCDSKPCKNGGQCLPSDGMNGLCFCDSPYSGLYCESVGCTPSPCQNNQNCVLGINKQPVCLCTSAFTGAYCEVKA